MKENNIIDMYGKANVAGRLKIIWDNYAKIPKELMKAEKIIIYKIKAEREYIRSHNRENLSTRVQTSVISNPTESEALDNILLEEAFITGRIDAKFVENIEEIDGYREDIRRINNMRMDYELFTVLIETLEEKEVRIIKPFLLHEKSGYELADQENITYAAVRKRIEKVKRIIYGEMIECMEYLRK